MSDSTDISDAAVEAGAEALWNRLKVSATATYAEAKERLPGPDRIPAGLRRDAKAVLSAARPHLVTDRADTSGWLIEHGGMPRHQPIYWQGAGRWSDDHQKAIRFSRHADAFAVSLTMERNDELEPHRIVEHAWSLAGLVTDRGELSEGPTGEIDALELAERVLSRPDSSYESLERAIFRLSTALRAARDALAPAAGQPVGIKGLIDAASAIVAKLDAINASPSMRAVFESAFMHGVVYDGPNYDAVLEELRSALAHLPRDRRGGDGHAEIE